MTTAEDGWKDPSAKDLAPEPDFRPIPRKKPKARRGRWVFLAVLMAAVAAGAGGWYVLDRWLGVGDPDAEVPLIRADAGPIKVRPEEPGGMDVPDRDKRIYDRIDGNGERSTVEHLLPPPEMPMPRPAPETALAPEQPVAAPEPSLAEAVPPVPPPAPPATAEGAPPPAPQSVVPSVEKVLSAMRPPPPVEPRKEEPPAEARIKAEAAKAAAPARPGNFLVQLAALRGREQVDAEWDRLRRRNSDLLGHLELSVMRADLGPDKGVFYRLRVGPLADEAAAKTLCQKLSERKVGCLVIRPGG